MSYDDVSLDKDHCMQKKFQYSLHHVSGHDHCMQNAPIVPITYFQVCVVQGFLLLAQVYCLSKCKRNGFSR